MHLDDGLSEAGVAKLFSDVGRHKYLNEKSTLYIYIGKKTIQDLYKEHSICAS